MKYVLGLLAVAGLGLAAVLVLSGGRGSRVEIVIAGPEAAEVRIDGDENALVLEPGRAVAIEPVTKIAIGEARITIGDRVEIVNTGEDVLPVSYRDEGGEMQTMLIGKGGTAYVDGAEAFRVGDAEIRVGEGG